MVRPEDSPCSSSFQQRLKKFAQAFRKEWDMQVIPAEDWSKLCYYAAHPEYDTPEETALLEMNME